MQPRIWFSMQNQKKTTDQKNNQDKPFSVNDPLTEGEDYYFEGGYFVFTEKYHLKRGYCCKNGCRHCPYKKNNKVP